jgi:hypothetical protein
MKRIIVLLIMVSAYLVTGSGDDDEYAPGKAKSI